MSPVPSKRKYRRSTDPLLARLKSLPQYSRKYGDKSGTLDPYEVYRVRARELATVAEAGLERFAYDVFGPDLMASLAFAIDPISKFRFTGAKISPTNRTRSFTSIWPQNGGYKRYRSQIQCTNLPDLTTIDPFDRTPVNCVTTSTPTTDSSFGAFPGSFGFVSDTTIRTRPLDSSQGEFELFVPTLLSMPRTISSFSFNESYAMVGGHLQVSTQKDVDTSIGYGPAIYIPSTSYNVIRTTEQADATTYFNKYGYGLLRDTLPEHPQFNLFYNIAELKDIPVMLRNTVRLFKDFQSELSSMKGIGDQYLNYKFGWESTVNAVKDLLYTPTRIAKRINYLLKRRGKPTTYRTKKTFLTEVSSVPSATFYLYATESLKASGISTSRKVELRLMLNATLDFPNVSIPEVRSDLWTTLLGAYPTPTDLFNLVPWTWLIDWFSGAGDYLTLIDRISRDPSLVNFGFISYVSSGRINYTYETQTTSTHAIIYPPQPLFSESIINRFNHTSVVAYRYHRRKDVTSIGGVKAVSKPTTLSADQLAIVGALLTKWHHN
jgi:hypothetical protein